MAKKTTAISRYNVIATYGSGKAGNVRLYQKGNRSYLRAAYNGSVTRRRSENQLRRRLRWANVSNAWQFAKPFSNGAFEDAVPGCVSSANIFMRANSENGIYLTKDLNRQGFVKIMPFVISEGSLPTVTNGQKHVESTTNVVTFHTNLNFTLNVTAATTIGEISEELLSQNNNLRVNDEINIVFFEGEGSLQVGYNSFVLNPNDQAVDAELNAVIVADQGFSIKNPLITDVMESGCAVVHSRKFNGRLMVSTERLTCTSGCNYAEYLDQAEFEIAAASYGGYDSEVAVDPFDKIPLYKVILRVMPNPSDGTVTGAGSYHKGTEVEITATPATGKVFDKWSDGVTLATRTIKLQSDVTLNAIFKNQ